MATPDAPASGAARATAAGVTMAAVSNAQTASYAQTVSQTWDGFAMVDGIAVAWLSTRPTATMSLPPLANPLATPLADPFDDPEWVSADDRRRRHVAGRWLLAELATELGIDGDGVGTRVVSDHCTLCGKAHGRPWLLVGESAIIGSATAPTTGHGPTSQGYRLPASISHSGGLTIAALALRGTVGIDVESLAAHREPALDGDTLQAWTRTEAILKADGRGLTVPIEDVVTSPAAAPSIGRKSRGLHNPHTATIVGSPVRYRTVDLTLPSGWVGSLASAR